MKSTNATILQIKDRTITIRLLPEEVVGLVGKDVKINGLRTAGLRDLPSNEADACMPDLSSALAYRFAEEDDISSLTIGSCCEVTWE